MATENFATAINKSVISREMLPVECMRFPVLSYLQSKDPKLIVIPILLMSIGLNLHGTVTFYRNLIKRSEF